MSAILKLPISGLAMNASGPNADQRFVDYYAQQSASESTQHRFKETRRITLALRAELGLSTRQLDIVDIGCGAGAQTLMWANDNHCALGIDVSEPLIELARERATSAGLDARFAVGTAAQLPLPDSAVDVVLISELLEHLKEWEPCVDEALRVLRPGGVVYLSTTNRLCPVQQEFTLPGYSWYPRVLKAYCEKLAVTTHGHWVQFASLPAVHWFSFYQLRDYLDTHGVSARDRFDMIDRSGSLLRRAVLGAVRTLAPLRFAGHVLTPYTVVVGFRRASG